MTSTEDSTKPVLAIEDGNETSGRDVGDDVKTIDVANGEPVKVDKLGPLVLNTDGTLAR